MQVKKAATGVKIKGQGLQHFCKIKMIRLTYCRLVARMQNCSSVATFVNARQQ